MNRTSVVVVRRGATRAQAVDSPIRRIPRASAAVVLLLSSVQACNNDVPFTRPLDPVRIVSIQPSASTGAAARILYDGSPDAVLRVRYASADQSDSGATPWLKAAGGSLPLLGLRPGTRYNVSLEVAGSTGSQESGRVVYDATPLPAGLAGIALRVVAGGPLSHGYSLANLTGADNHGYAVAFDSAGVIRWYRDFGPRGTFEVKQQANGDITAFVGRSDGFNPVAGGYVEVTPSGDSVRTVMATGSPYTDPHELMSQFDASGVLVADYLSGYDIRTADRTADGGSVDAPLAGHQILRMTSAGAVDTLLQGWSRWSVADIVVQPVLVGDFDHPNSIDIDRDGTLVVSYRDLSTIVKLDPRTHAILWQLGGRQNQFTMVNDPLGGFWGQHDVRVLPNGHLLMFDNGWNHPTPVSRAVEYALDLTRKTATMVWEYRASPAIFTQFTGSAQRLSNGNTVIGFTTQRTLVEVDRNGALVSRMAYQSPTVGEPYRFRRIDNLYTYVRP